MNSNENIKFSYSGCDYSFETKCPDGGCPAIVMRTAFSTTQGIFFFSGKYFYIFYKGKLMGQILFSANPTSANTAESFFLLFFLLLVASVTSVYVYFHAPADQSPYKLFLRVFIFY
jgi:hypothetical protein